MRRTASEIIRNLEIRVARLEGRTAAPRGMRNLDALDYEQMGAGSVADAIFADADSVRDWLYNEYDLSEFEMGQGVEAVSATVKGRTIKIVCLPKMYSPQKCTLTIQVNPNGSYTDKQEWESTTPSEHARLMPRGSYSLPIRMF